MIITSPVASVGTFTVTVTFSPTLMSSALTATVESILLTLKSPFSTTAL